MKKVFLAMAALSLMVVSLTACVPGPATVGNNGGNNGSTGNGGTSSTTK